MTFYPTFYPHKLMYMTLNSTKYSQKNHVHDIIPYIFHTQTHVHDIIPYIIYTQTHIYDIIHTNSHT